VTVDGKHDVPFLASERRYVLSGAQHSGPAAWPPPERQAMADIHGWRGNPLDQRLALRALLVNLTDWVTTNRPPPPSAYPSLRTNTLVRPEARVAPTMAGIATARLPYTPRRMSLGARWSDRRIVDEPPRLGAPYTVLVPRVDSIGNDLGGIQGVELRVPVATYLPWQFRHEPPMDRLASFQGTFIPLARTDAERRTREDFRPSLQALYPSRDAFLVTVDHATDALVLQRFLLAEDRARARARMADSWDWVMTH